MKKQIFCKVKKLEDAVNSNIENIFIETSEKFKLKTGDITPNQSSKLDVIKANIYQLLAEYINQNQR